MKKKRVSNHQKRYVKILQEMAAGSLNEKNKLKNKEHMAANYPIAAYANEILRTIKDNSCVVICAETGAGKTTQIPQMLLLGEDYYNKEVRDPRNGTTFERLGKYNMYDDIIVTCPTKISAISIAEHVANELGTFTGELVGFETSDMKKTSSDTVIRYSTEGFENLREIHSRPEINTKRNRVLIIDDFYKFGIDVETLIAWERKLKFDLKDNFFTKVILMAAPGCFDAEGISAYLDAPIINIPGRTYEVEEEICKPFEFEKVIYEEASLGKNVLAFVPGKGEITQTIKSLQNTGIQAKIFPLHADLSTREQEDALKTYDVPKIIIATNVAQSSITIKDIDVVVDSGMERRIVEVDGIYVLDLGVISNADRIQRKGRAGRTKKGKYYWCGSEPINMLSRYPIPAIESGELDRIILQLASVGVGGDGISFFHQPDAEKIRSAQSLLKTIEALDDRFEITEMGKIMARIPLSARYSRMVVEAQRLGVADNVITIAAIQQCGGIKKPSVKYSSFVSEEDPKDKNNILMIKKSDLLADLVVFNKARDYEKHVVYRKLSRVMEVRSKVYDRMYELFGEVSSKSKDPIEDTIRACITGIVDMLYVHNSGGWYSNPRDDYKRKLNLASGILGTPKYVFGIPKNIVLSAQTLYIVYGASVLEDTNMLYEISPELISYNEIAKFNPEENAYSKTCKTFWCNEILIDEYTESVYDENKKAEILVNWLTKCTVYGTRFYEPRSENLKKIFAMVNEKCSTEEDIRKYYAYLIDDAFPDFLPNFKKTKHISLLLRKTCELFS